jgi:2',3'-cyclic-nucleotide 2'-phosphodiesterase (5'-nucleotidase family)
MQPLSVRYDGIGGYVVKRKEKHVTNFMGKVYLPIFTLFLVILILLQTVDITEVSAKEKKQSVTILFTNDLHDNLLPFQTVENGETVELGGYARLKSAIDAEKKSSSNAILVDAGDFSMGTPFQTIFMSDAPELRILGALGYDVSTLGNHEFDYRPAGLAGSLEAAAQSGDKVPKFVQSNIVFPTDKAGKMTTSVQELRQAMEKYGVYDYTIIEREGVRIGVFGLMGKEAISMAPMSEVTFRDEVKQAKRVVKILKEQEKVDFILCLSHSGTNSDKKKSEDEKLAKEVPEINMIISGHTHTTLAEPILVGNTVIGSTGSYGKRLGVVRLT